jgi:hypothetical protein
VTKLLTLLAVVATAGVVAWSAATADELPISGTVKAIDMAGRTLTLQSVAGGKTRDVTIMLKPESKIVKFVRPADAGKAGFVEQALSLSDLKLGWILSVTTRHEGDKEVADVVKVVLER